MEPISSLENFFSHFRRNVIGRDKTFETPFGKKEILYADWTASGRAYLPIEECLVKEILPFIANTHSLGTVTGTIVSKAYETAKLIVKKHVNANGDDVLIFCGSGMTAAVNKLQRILGMRIPERMIGSVKSNNPSKIKLEGNAMHPRVPSSQHLQHDDVLKPVVFVTHMEHHSNHISWLETIASVEIISAAKNGNVDLESLRRLLDRYKYRKNKIAAITACSNVTGIETPYHQVAKLMHDYGGLCFVDFACSAPFTGIDMHPKDDGTHLDAIYFSPHKFLGGPGTAGVLVFNKKMYSNLVPDQPGGGTIAYSNPWKVHEYVANIEEREDGGTPPILQGIKAGLCIRLKEAMGIDNIVKREQEMLTKVFDRFSKMKNVEVLENNVKNRFGIISFIVPGAHYGLIVKLLNDRFGIQTRGGCSCAGTYGHMLLQVDETTSYKILDSIHSGELLYKPGWIRFSLHPTMTNAEIDFIMNSIEETASNFRKWMNDYRYNPASNEYIYEGFERKETGIIEGWFNLGSDQQPGTSDSMIRLTEATTT